ncbi:membrane protein [Aurantiacibacter atlanticus]|uniref:Membrane protein n=1 Tax=Aurantiacibacter atlanticus TaxID=1648404 RepID=A0A0H4VDV5_9SPHN|nr:MAPEG family protein [Aurantiacibacter atlanticus]AKQ42872.1 membrane protein [Aurantiacibacter atlanticus]MDF1835080.1 MAPEG family protein [Alteraurantiacibacter sp. bin_em_oilr2.035]
MPAELTVLGLAAILLLVHIFAAIRYKTQQYGKEWNMGARDEDLQPLNDVAGRLDRARGNFLETLPLAIIALGGVVIADKASTLTAIAAWIWLGARVIYLPLYWAGIPKVRTLIWLIALLALIYPLGVLLLA